MRRTLALSLAALALTAGGVAGCGGSSPGGGSSNGSTGAPAPVESNPAGDIPDDQAFVTYTPPAGGFTVKVPEGWARGTSGGSTVFTDKLNRIEIATVDTPAPPSPASVTAKTVPVLREKVPAFSQGKASMVTRHAGQAVLLTYRGDGAPDEVTGKTVHDAFERYTFYHRGQEVDLTLSGPVGADNVDPWRIVSDSLRWR
ncbi:hypothetical protein [Streptomyces sp. NPDC058603]|uniref:hypothetical protein n=1 Tax=Streptomyces sp. NPDC058603 TaxID=3346551 RepID=UPI00364AB816